MVGVMLSSSQERTYSLGDVGVTQKKHTRVCLGAVATENYVVVGRAGSCETSTTVENSTHKLTGKRVNQSLRVMVIDKHQLLNRIVSIIYLYCSLVRP